MEHITSLKNPRIKTLLALQERRERRSRGAMLVEGFDELSLALKHGFKPLEFYYAPSLARHKPDGEWARIIKGVPSFELGEDAFRKVAYRENPDGWLAVLPLPQKSLNALKLSSKPLILVVEAVEKPGNLGAMLRTADAAGVEAVIACDPLADWGNPNVVRASKGTVFTVQVADASSQETLAWLQDHTIQVVAAVPNASRSYTQADLTRPTAIVMGAEHQGLSPLWQQVSHVKVAIPMLGQVNSLNVSASAAILLYEAVRQRSS